MRNIKAYLKRVAKAVLNKPQAVYNAEKEYKVLLGNPEGELFGKTAIVTGGSGTLGRSICHILAAQGASVYVGGRDSDRINKVVNDINRESQCCGISIDVTDENSIKEQINYIFNKEGKIDILVNCAGGSARSRAANLIKQDVSVVESILDSNLLGTIMCSKYVAEKMVINKSGCIVNIASTTGIQGNGGNCDYTASKSGVIGFTKALAQEVGEYGIRVNCVSPGFIQTGTFNEERVEYLKRTNFLRSVGEAEDIGNAVEFLASEKAKFITGVNLVVDGGRILGLHTFNC